MLWQLPGGGVEAGESPHDAAASRRAERNREHAAALDQQVRALAAEVLGQHWQTVTEAYHSPRPPGAARGEWDATGAPRILAMQHEILARLQADDPSSRGGTAGWCGACSTCSRCSSRSAWMRGEP